MLQKLAWAGAGALFLLVLALSVSLTAASALTRVALRRLSSEAGPRLSFLESLHDAWSAHRAATGMARQLSLMGGTLLVAVAAGAAGSSWTGIIVLAAGTLLAVLCVEFVVAHVLALWDPKTALRSTAFLARLAYVALYPIVRPLHLVLRRMGRDLPASPDRDEQEDEEEVEAYLEVGEREGIIEASESQMMRSIVDLDETHVREIMTPRTDIVALPESASLAHAVRTMVRVGHSRLPVYRETIDNVVGVLHVRDVLRLCEAQREGQTISGELREVEFVPEMMSVAELLGEMRVGSHIAMVVDEYGGIAGLVTLEDLLEEIVGDIRDEHERAEPLVREGPDGSWIIHGAAHVDEVEKRFEVELGERGYDTVGGWVVSGFGHLPTAGERLSVQGLEIEVLKADRRRIHLVRVRPALPSGEARAGP